MVFRATLALRRSGGSGREWMQQQSQDPFVAEARRQGYIARSAFKLTHLDDRFGLFDRQKTRAVIDLGCSPGGWCQVARERCGDSCLLFGVDLLPVKATIPNAVFLKGDFTSPAVQQELRAQMAHHGLVPTSRDAAGEGKVDVALSDMCPNRSGGTQDRQRIAALDQEALAFVTPLLRTGGHFVCKVLGSRQSYSALHDTLTTLFLTVHTCKPPASRAQSDEMFLIGHSKLAEPRRASLDSRGRVVVGGGADGGGRYGLDDWPGFARAGGKKSSRPSQHGNHQREQRRGDTNSVHRRGRDRTTGRKWP